ncbi:MAG: TolC family protein [Gammaproteobacteria bacterium]|nr:TolC family protein [Gammaproteobacteria bacterium]
MLSIPLRLIVLTTLTLCLILLSGCLPYRRLEPPPEMTQKVEKRLSEQKSMTLSEWSSRKPQSIDDALDMQQRKQLLNATENNSTNQKSSTGIVQANPAAKQANDKLTLTDARQLALKNNLKLQIALFEPAIAETVVNEEMAKFDDLIFANVKYGRKRTPLLDGNVVGFKPVDEDSPLDDQIAKLDIQTQNTELLELEAGVIIPLRSGAKVKISSPLSSKGTTRFVPSEQNLSGLRFSISQPLLRNAGFAVNESGIRIAQYQQQAINLTTRLQMIRVLAASDKAFWNYYAAWESLAVRYRQYGIATQNLTMVKRRVAEGMVAKIEINRAEIGVSERMAALIIAKTKLKLAQRKLMVVLNDPQYALDSAQFFIPESQPTLLSFTFDRQQLINKALQGRLELLELELKLAADAVKIDYLENQTLPMFMLDYKYGVLGRGDDFSDAYDDAFSGDFNDWSIGFKVEIPVTNQARKSRLSRAVQQRLQRLKTQQLKELSVRREIHDVLDTLEQNWQRILANRQIVILAGTNYDAEVKQFQAGIRTMTEVINALNKLGDAQIKEIKAISDYQISLIDLAYATGTSLGYSQVDLMS